MKVKDIERTANVAWSPKTQYPIYLAAGTAAQQLDASFNTSAALEIYSLNIAEPGPDTTLVSSVPSEQRFHKIIWGSYGGDQSSGTLISGCDGGLIQIYSASKLLKGEDGLIGKQQKHSGPVHALDFNNFQHNLFATGAAESEIFIWDLNNTSTPMSPGTKSQPLEDILCVEWNKQVQHILASTFASKCVIWDLRKNEPIIKLTDTVSRIRWKVLAWHPEVATQLCLASEEDHSPIIQMWDLRFATSPLKTLENHQRGVLSLAWCNDDSNLLVSCGKDDRILCWNPNSNHPNGEILAEIAKTNQWSFDVVWCPRNPALIACPNYDGHVSIYSLMGGKVQQIQTTNKIADSFPGMDGYVQAPMPQAQSLVQVSVDLSKPPKWLKRPVGASFAFGGKLITFGNEKDAVQFQQNPQAGQVPPLIRRTVEISQVITEPELVQKSTELEQALEYGNFTEYCFQKAEQTQDQHKKYIWHFLKATFEASPRTELLNLLGYKIEDVNAKLCQHVGHELQSTDEQYSNINRLDELPPEDQFSLISQNSASNKFKKFKINTGDDMEGLITQALLLNNVEAAVELCLKAERYADALIIATTGGPDLLAKTQHKYLEKSDGYISSLMSAMISEDWGSVINNCDITSWKEALVAALAHASDEDFAYLCEQLGRRLEIESTNNPKLAQDAQLCYICAGSFDQLVNSWSGNATNTTNDLQELVEFVSFLKKSVERQGKNVQISGALANLLTIYASLLASQGNLATAITYLGASQNEKVESLRDRLLTSLGHKPANIQEMRQQQRRDSSRTSLSSSFAGNLALSTNPFHAQNQFSNPPGASQLPVLNTAAVPPPIPSSQFSQPKYNTGLPSVPVANQPWQTQPVPAPSVPAPPVAQNFNPQPPPTFSPTPQAPPPMQPPRPSSVGSAHGGSSSGRPSRKYILDPSVTSNQYGTRGQFGPIPPQPVSTFQNNTLNSNSNPYSVPPLNPIQSNPVAPIPNHTFNPIPSVPNSTAFSSNPSVFSPTPQLPNTAPPVSNAIPQLASNSLNGSMQQNVGFHPPVEMGQPAEKFVSNSPPGWNDPPVFDRPPKSQSRADPSSVEPITHPIFGSAPVDQPVAALNGSDRNIQPMSQYNAMPYPPNQPAVNQTQMYQPPPPPSFNPNNFNSNAIVGSVQPPQTKQFQDKSKPKEVEKAPIPEEHLHLKIAFGELRERCSCSTNNPQMKRKLDDVTRRLENLYDCLREHKLSPNALAALHQMAQFVQNGDYPSGLQLHTQLVQGPDFAQIAGFMPGLKVLLQSALQLQVYLH